jgi:hypothetical protein
VFISDAPANIGSTTVIEAGQVNALYMHQATLICITVTGEPDAVTAAIARHVGEAGSVYLELPDGRLALIVDLSGASRLTWGEVRYLRD